MLRNDIFVSKLNTARLELIKDYRERHQLCHARRLHRLVGILLEEHRAGIGIDQDCLLRLGRKIGTRRN